MENERYKYFEFANGYKVIEETETNIEYCSLNSVVELLNRQDAKIKELKTLVDKYKQDYENCSKLEKNITKEHQYCLDNWRACEKENQQLKEQLKEYHQQNQKAIVSKFKIGQCVYICIDKEIECAKIEKIIITISKNDEECSVFYSITDSYGYALRLPEEQIFETKKEAENQIKELRGEE